MNERIPYDPDTNLVRRGTQTFFVDPNVSNEGQVFPIAGSRTNYPYKLPFLSHVFPVRKITVFSDNSLVVDPPIGVPTYVLITLRKADGTYLLDQVPLTLFTDGFTMVNGFGLAPNVPLLFTPDFFPDPRMSFVQWTLAAQTARVGIKFDYA